jgi:predicted amidohydrolase YtcJ
MGVRLLPSGARRGAAPGIGKTRRRRRGIAVAAASAGVLMAATGVAGAWDDDGRSPSPSSSWHDGWDGADTVFLNGRILQYTRGGKGYDYAEALVVDNGVIKYVGNRGRAVWYIGDETKLVNLRGKLMMPGLGDGHWHGAGVVQCGMDYEGGTIDQVLGKIKACLLKPGQVEHLKSNSVLSVSQLQGDGLLPTGTQLDRHVLDRLSKDPSEDPFGTGTTRPIVVRNMDGHKFATNSKAITNAGLNAQTPDPPDGFIGREADGYPNGQFADFSANFGPSLPNPPDATYNARAAAIARSNSLGITQLLRPGGSAADLAVNKRLADDGKLTVHMNQALSAGAVRGETDAAAVNAFIEGINTQRRQYDGYRSSASPGDLEVDTVKIFCDGVPEFPGQTAAMLEPYRVNVGTPENPQWVPGTRRGEDPSCEDARLGFTKLDAAKWNIHVHSLGDRSTRVTLDNYEAATKQNRRWDRRHAITHLEFIDEKDIPRFGKLGVVASMSLQWSRRDAWSVHGIEGYVAPDVMDKMYPANSLRKGGSVVAYGSDWPVTDLMPWVGIETGATRIGEVNEAKAVYPGMLEPASERLPLLESVKASTLGVAYQLHRDDVAGSIERGKLADLIVVDQNIFKVPVSDISETKVLMTMVNGKVVYSDPASTVTP